MPSAGTSPGVSILEAEDLDDEPGVRCPSFRLRRRLPEETESTEQELGTTDQALCEGWDNGARYCTWRCTASQTTHYFAGYGDVPHGNCREYADRWCGRSAYSVCWSKL